MAKRLIKPEPWTLDITWLDCTGNDRSARIQGDLIISILIEYEKRWGADKLKKLLKHMLWIYDISGEYYMLEDDDESVDKTKRKTPR